MLCRCLCGMLLLANLSWATHGGELKAGIGYGEQVGLTGYSQDNAVVDVLYDFYFINGESWRFSLGTGVSWLWNDFDRNEVWIGSVLPSLRFYFPESAFFKPYAFVTTGFSYLTEPKLGHQILGGYFAFNDFFGVGTYLGHDKRWSVEWCWRHISNAGFFEPNQGIDVPLCILVGRRF